ncbi:hypothetical protein WN48_06095 [Eufriesea mexicana]|nr:hypothetical protein WN48_06095 [Eufriesea mexicana]
MSSFKSGVYSDTSYIFRGSKLESRLEIESFVEDQTVGCLAKEINIFGDFRWGLYHSWVCQEWMGFLWNCIANLTSVVTQNTSMLVASEQSVKTMRVEVGSVWVSGMNFSRETGESVEIERVDMYPVWVPSGRVPSVKAACLFWNKRLNEGT